MKKNVVLEIIFIFLFLFTLGIVVGDAIKLIKIFKIQRHILKLNEKIELTHALDKKVGNITTSYLQVQSKYEFVNNIIPNSPDDSRAAKELSTLADRGNIVFIELLRGKEYKIAETELGSLHSVDFTIEFIGTYKDSVLFLNNLKKLVRLFTIKKVTMENIENMLPNIFTSVKLNAYYIK